MNRPEVKGFFEKESSTVTYIVADHLLEKLR